MFKNDFQKFYKDNGSEESHDIMVSKKIYQNCNSELIRDFKLKVAINKVFGYDKECYKDINNAFEIIVQMPEFQEKEGSALFKKGRVSCQKYYLKEKNDF